MPQLLSLRSRACKPQLLSQRATTTEALAPRARAPQQEKPLQREAHAPQQRVAPARRNERKPARSNEDLAQPKKQKTNKKKYSELKGISNIAQFKAFCLILPKKGLQGPPKLIAFH